MPDSSNDVITSLQSSWEGLITTLSNSTVDWEVPHLTSQTTAQTRPGPRRTGEVSFGSISPRNVTRNVSISPFDVASEEDHSQEINGEEMSVSEVFGVRPDNSTVVGHSLVNGTHRVGIEIELENINTTMHRPRYWRQIEDGSLRNNGAEFIFRDPYGGIDLFNAVVEIDTHLHALKPDASVRCSTHVHVDVRDMTADQVKKMILAYMVMERILFRCSGWHRYKNNFCVALGFAESMIRTLSDCWNRSNNDFLRGVVRSWDKYTAINLLPMRDKGSIEFRISEPKWRKGQLLRLCNRFLALKEVAMNWSGTETELVLHLADIHPSKVLRKGFLNNIDIMPNDLHLGAKMAMDIINLSRIPRMTIPETTEVSLEDLFGDEDTLLPTSDSGSSTWTAIKFACRGDENHKEVFGELFEAPYPNYISASLLYKIERTFPITASRWIHDNGTSLQGYRDYCVWYDNNVM